MVIALALYAAAPGADAAKAFIDGEELLRICRAAADSEFVRATDCLGYITGAWDAHEAFVSLNITPRQWCFPKEGVSNREAARVVLAYLEANPGVLEESAALLSTVAFFEAYRCK
jgi:hypothetical protein